MSCTTQSFSFNYNSSEIKFYVHIFEKYVILMLINDGKFQSVALFNEYEYPSACYSFENFKKFVLERKNYHLFLNLGSNIIFESSQFPKFTVKFQPHVSRTNAMIENEIETYFKSIDSPLETILSYYEHHVKIYGCKMISIDNSNNLIETMINKIESIVGVAYADIKSIPIFAKYYYRIEAIKKLHEKHADKITKECDEITATIKKNIIEKPNDDINLGMLHDIVKSVVDEFIVKKNTIVRYKFNTGELVDTNVETCIYENKKYAEFIGGIVENIIGDGTLNLQLYYIEIGNYSKIFMDKIMKRQYYVGKNGFTRELNNFIDIDKSFTPSVIMSLFPHPTKNGVLIDANGTFNEAQQHVIDVLNKYIE